MKFVGLLVILFTLFAITQADYIIDAFRLTQQPNVTGIFADTFAATPDNNYKGIEDPDLSAYVYTKINPITNETVTIYPNLYFAESYVPLGGGVLTGVRRVVLTTLTNDLTYAPQNLVAYSTYADNTFNFAIGSDQLATLQLQYVGNYDNNVVCTTPVAGSGLAPQYVIQCPDQLDIGPLNNAPVDVTENGLDQAFSFIHVALDYGTIGITISFYTTVTAYSTIAFDLQPIGKRDEIVDEDDPNFGIMSWDVPLANPIELADGRRVVTGRRYVFPFTRFQRPRAANASADFTEIRGATFNIARFGSIDLTVADFRTVPLVSQTKTAAVIDSISPADSIAQPGELINFTVAITAATGLDAPIQNVYFYDNPNKFSGYATYLPESVSLSSVLYTQVNCTPNTTTCIDQFTPDPTNFGATVLTAANDAYFADRIAIFIPLFPSGSVLNVNFQVRVNNLPCVMTVCSTGCNFATQAPQTGGACYCEQNQGRVCLNVGRNLTASIARALDASNDTSLRVNGCAATTDIATQTYITSAPIGTTPNPALTIVADATQKANGVFPCNAVTYTVSLTNNRTRSSDSFNVVLTPDQYTVCTTGAGSPNPTLTTDAVGRPVYSVSGGLQFGQSLTFQITCNASCNLACGVNQTNMQAAIDFGANTQNCPELTDTDNTGSDFIPLIGTPSITLSKANSTALTYGANGNNVASFNITYSNVGQRPAPGVVITETIPSELAAYYQASDNPSFVSAGGNTYTYTIPTLGAGETGVIAFLLRGPPSIADCTTGSFINTVSSSAVCGSAGLNATAYVGVNAIPDVAVTIANVSASVQPGATVCYNVGYQNVGYRVAQQVVLSINVPAFTTYSSSGSAAGWTQSGTSSVYTLSVGDVAAQSAVVNAQFCVTAQTNTVCGSSFSTSVNITSVCASFPETNLVNNYAATSPTTIAGTVTLTLTKTPTVNGAVVSTTGVAPGATVVYVISGTNTGSAQAQQVTIVETLPTGTTAGANSGFTLGSDGTYTYSVGTVNAGASFGPVNFTVVVPSSVACPAGNISNTATVTETCNAASAVATSIININASPLISVVAQNDTSVTLSTTTQTCFYACYSNTGSQTANTALLTLNYDGTYLTPVSSALNGWTAGSAGVLTFPAGDLAPGSNTCSPSVCFTVPTPIPCGVNNVTYTVTLSSPCAPNQQVTDTAVTTIIANPVFTITKSNNIVGDASPGDAVTYTITYQNTGLRIADNTVLTESVPSLIVPGTNNGWTCSGQTCTRNVGSLSSSQGPVTVTFSGSLSTDVPGRTTVNNTVTIAAPEPCSSTASASSILSVAGYPNLVISKTDNGVTIKPGDYIYYTITYTNNGDAAAPNTIITDIIPAFTKFNATLSNVNGGTWSCPDGVGAGTVCTVNVGTVNQGQSGTVTIVVKSADWIRCGVDYTQNFVYINTTVQESNYNDNNATDTTPIMGEPDLVLMKTSNRTSTARKDRAGPGDLITYNITYSNVGLRDATFAALYETVPEYTTFVAAASTPGWSCADGSVAGTVCVVAWNSSLYPSMPGMEGMGMGQLVFSVRVINDLPPEAHITTNCAHINNTCGDCNPFNNMDCHTVTLFGVPDLVLNQTAICRSIHWYIEWQNTGDQGATNVVLTDTVPASTNFVPSSSDSRWSCNNDSTSVNFRTCTLNIGDVPSGAGGSAVFVTSPQAGTTLDMFTNTASVTGTGRNPDPTPENNQDTATVGFSGCPDACDSCCPLANECCPDKTEVLFNFRGILQGIDSCAASSSS